MYVAPGLGTASSSAAGLPFVAFQSQVLLKPDIKACAHSWPETDSGGHTTHQQEKIHPLRHGAQPLQEGQTSGLAPCRCLGCLGAFGPEVTPSRTPLRSAAGCSPSSSFGGPEENTEASMALQTLMQVSERFLDHLPWAGP